MTAPRPSVLIVDDEAQIRTLLARGLEKDGYRVFEAESGQAGLTQAANRKPDAILLDLGLPDLDGLTVLARLREWSRVPVLVLTVRDSEEDKVAALDGGADDYVTKPFSLPELLARLRVALRHTKAKPEESSFAAGPLRVDLLTREVFVDGRPVALTKTEYELLRVFIRNAGRVLTHKYLLTEVWGPNNTEHSQYLRVYISHLRDKLNLKDDAGPTIRNEPGVGYRFVTARKET